MTVRPILSEDCVGVQSPLMQGVCRSRNLAGGARHRSGYGDTPLVTRQRAEPETQADLQCRDARPFDEDEPSVRGDDYGRRAGSMWRGTARRY